MSQGSEPVGPAWWQIVWTSLFSAGAAAVFTLLDVALRLGDPSAWRTPLDWLEGYGQYLVVSLVIGNAIHLLFTLGRHVFGKARISRFRGWQRGLYFGGLPLVGTLAGIFGGNLLLGFDPRAWSTSTQSRAALSSVIVSAMVWFVFAGYFSGRARRLQAERRAAQAQLRLLQAQMEPHFLFNTLANVVGLIDVDAARAKQMLESFTDYLRASLSSLRRSEHTLGDELELVDAYLRVVQVRMEERLRYCVDVPAPLRALQLPSLSLQPLVENAVVHGLEPAINGGEVRIHAAVRDGALVVQVSDNGVGLQRAATRPGRGTGTALNNIRERLAQTHGERAGLRVEASQPHGVCCTLTLPTTS
jgi:signal transduction histidine kinase